ncbi:MAG: DUF58 domain-containing protein [Pseudomonadota bacterium]
MGVNQDALTEQRTRVQQSDLIALRHDARALSLQALRVKARKGGQYLSHFKGRGMEFDEARPYQAGDDPRSIDWRVTARTGRPYTKLFREERERPVFCWVDQRQTMRFATRGVFKAVQAARLAALLGWSAVQRGDRLGGFLFNDLNRYELRPMLGKRAVLRMIHQLEQLQQPVGDAPRPNLQRTLAGLRRVAHPGSLIAMISDFAGFDEVCAAHLRALAAHNNLMVCFVYDELERQLPPAGVYPIQVGPHRLQVDTGGAQASRWAEKFDARVAAIESICRVTGSALRLIDTQASPLAALQSMTGKVR